MSLCSVDSHNRSATCRRFLVCTASGYHSTLALEFCVLGRVDFLKHICFSLNVNLRKTGGDNFCTWYQKPSDTGTILNYSSCASLQHKKSIIQGTIHRLFRATSNWEAFDEALTKNEICERNQYSRQWVGNIFKDTINQLRMKEHSWQNARK